MLEQADVDLILDICKGLPRGVRLLVADVGAGVGTTALTAFTGLDNCQVISVDTDHTSTAQASRIATSIGRGKDWVGQCGGAVEVAGYIDDATIDLLLLDTLHYYETTKAELEAWLPKVKPYGVIWVHDYMGEHDGVQRAVDALIVEGRIKTTETRGLSWSGVKA